VAVGASAAAGTGRVAVALLAPPGAGGLGALAGQGASPAHLRRLDPEGALALRWDGDCAELGRRLVPAVSAHDRAWLAAHGFDLQRDLFDQLAPGAAAVVALSPSLDLAGLGEVELRADPLRLVRFELVAEVKDEAAARGALARLQALADAMAAPMRRPTPPASPAPRRKGGPRPPQAPAIQPAPSQAPALQPPPLPPDRIITPSGEIAWRLDGKRLAMAGGPLGALERLLGRLGGGGPGFAASTPAAQAALSGGLGGAVLDTQRLIQRVRALPDEAFGTGPTGFLVRSMVERVLEPAGRLAAISARADLGPGALVITLTVESQPAPGGSARGEGVQ
jgi:hypothetical protein